MGVFESKQPEETENQVNQSLAKATHSDANISLSDLAQILSTTATRPVGHHCRHFYHGQHLLHRLHATLQPERGFEIQKESPDGLGLDTMMSGPGGPGDALNAALDLQTQSEVLQSDTLALRVIEDLNLERTKDFKGNFSPVGWIVGLLSPSGVSDPDNASLEDSPVRRAHVFKVFSKNLKVKVDTGSRLIDMAI